MIHAMGWVEPGFSIFLMDFCALELFHLIPSNEMAVGNGLVDLGLLQATDSVVQTISATAIGAIRGTPAWTHPTQITAPVAIDAPLTRASVKSRPLGKNVEVSQVKLQNLVVELAGLNVDSKVHGYFEVFLSISITFPFIQ